LKQFELKNQGEAEQPKKKLDWMNLLDEAL